MATKRENRSGGSRGARRTPARRRDNEGMIPVLAKAVREVDIAIERNQMTSRHRARYQASALLARVERARIQADDTLTQAQRDNMMRRLDGVATNLARTAAREPSLFSLLQDDAEITDATRQLQREMQLEAGLEPAPEEASHFRGGDRAPPGAQGPAAVRGRRPARQPVPRPRLQRGEAEAEGPPGRVGADRARAQRVRAPRARRLGLHGAPRAAGRWRAFRAAST